MRPQMILAAALQGGLFAASSTSNASCLAPPPPTSMSRAPSFVAKIEDPGADSIITGNWAPRLCATLEVRRRCERFAPTVSPK